MDNKKSQKIHQYFKCICCDYNTSKKSDYIKHLSTVKHKMREKHQNDTTLSQNVAKCYKCEECGNMYKYESGYYRHKKKCLPTNNQPSDDKELIMMLINENK